MNRDFFRDQFENDEPATDGDRVVITDGPFHNFEGKVIEVDRILSLAVVALTIFGQETEITVNCGAIKKNGR